MGKVRIAFSQHSWDDLEMASRQVGKRGEAGSSEIDPLSTFLDAKFAELWKHILHEKFRKLPFGSHHLWTLLQNSIRTRTFIAKIFVTFAWDL